MSLVQLRLEDHVAVVTLNRPEALNAISGQVANELAGAFLQAAAQPDARVVVLAAAGEKAFCVGADLKERNRLDDRGWMRNRVLMRAMFDSVRSVPQPTIASAFGFALGGGFELALSCDLIVAADDAVFGLPEVTVGIVPGGGGTQLLARRIAATSELAGTICRSSPVGVREAKQAIDRALGVSLEVGIELEDLAWRRAVASDDRVEGIAAFNDKRDAEWKGR